MSTFRAFRASRAPIYMTSRRRWTPGEEDQRVVAGYAVSFKKPRSGRLLWIHTDARTPAEASRRVRGMAPDAYNEYGISRTYYRIWTGYVETITAEEYRKAKARPSRRLWSV